MQEVWNREDSSPSILGESLSPLDVRDFTVIGSECADGEIEAGKEHRSERSTVGTMEFRSASSVVVSRLDVRCQVGDSAETPCTGTRVSAST